MKTPKLIAFHLPQYHPIPENDFWWGTGFTEWRNVSKAHPLFPGHYQPHYPSDLGYYDLRVRETRSQQADLAKRYGVFGFCYYHYWFTGKQLLERPVAEILRSNEPDMPFCLCWANENWTRRWDGYDQEVLISQEYSEADDEAHIHALIPYFQDSRYIRIDGKPLFLVYRASKLPNPVATTSKWREVARKHGIPDIYLVKVESFFTERSKDPCQEGFDAALDFQPDWGSLPLPTQPSIGWKVLNKLKLAKSHPLRVNSIYNYSDVVRAMLQRQQVDYVRFPSVCPGWDNTARRQNGGATVLTGSTPEAYGHWLQSVLRQKEVMQKLPEPFVFVNAWNEWAEGNHLEPDAKWGHAYLEQTLSAIRDHEYP